MDYGSTSRLTNQLLQDSERVKVDIYFTFSGYVLGLYFENNQNYCEITIYLIRNTDEGSEWDFWKIEHSHFK